MCGKANEGVRTSEATRAGHLSLLKKITVIYLKSVELFWVLPLTNRENIGATERKDSEHID